MPLLTCAPVGTPGGSNRKKSALTPPATTVRWSATDAASIDVFVLPAAPTAPFTAFGVQQAARSMSSTWIAHGPCLTRNDRCSAPEAMVSVVPVSPSNRSGGRSALQRGDVVVGWPARTHAAPATTTSRAATVSRRGPLVSLIDAGLLIEVEGSAIDAIAQPRGIRTVVEDVAKMRAAILAHHLCAAH